MDGKMSIDNRPYVHWDEPSLQRERAKLQALAAEISAQIAALKTELFIRAIKEKS